MKEDQEVIAEFNDYVNVTASELDKWLKSDESSNAGWHKDGGDGESVGQGSGHKIVEILKTNPDKDPEKYTDDQIQHMRKVASYCKRHLAQEAKGLKEKGEEEAKKTKSYISLMNWGHDPLRAFVKEGSKSRKGGSKSSPGKRKAEAEEDGQDGHEDGVGEKDDDKAEEDDKHAGDKRKKSTQQNGANKKRETRQTRSSTKNKAKEEEEEKDQDGEDDQEDGNYEEDDGNDDSGDKSSKKGPKKGDTVSWNWGSGHPQGVVLDVKEGE